MTDELRISSDNEWPFGDEGIADPSRDIGFLTPETPGADGHANHDTARLQEPGILSFAQYAFSLDDRRLQINDVDCLISPLDISLCPGIRAVKKISGRTTDAAWSLRWLLGANCLSGNSSAGDVIRGVNHSNKVDASTAELSTRWQNGSREVQLCTHRELCVGRGQQLLLSVLYMIELTGKGDELLYCGAVQPSDYKTPRESLHIGWARKHIVLRATSRRRAFSAWVFRGSEQRSFPLRIDSECVAGVHSFQDGLSVEMPDWERARYFAMFIQPR